jgi:hypothetical protein
LLRQARALDPSAPVVLTAGNTFNSHFLLETMSLWPASLADSAFVNDIWQRQSLLQQARILVIDAGPTDLRNDWVPFLERFLQENQTLVVVAASYPSDVLAMLAVNNAKGTFRCAALRLNPTPETHGPLLQDIASVLRGSVVPANKLARTDASRLPLVPEIRANQSCTIACGLAVVTPPSMESQGALAAQRMAIYGRQAIRLTFGENSKARVDARVRYAARLLPAFAVPLRENETRIAPGERPASG